MIHKYKGYEIKKYERRYNCLTSWTEVWYMINGLNTKFDRLREAKQYIDNELK